MARRGRPPSVRAASARVIRVKLRLYTGEDDDLVAFFAGIPHRLRAAMVKQALRSGAQVPDQGLSSEDDDLFAALDAFVD